MIYEFYILFLKNNSRYNIFAWLIRKAQGTEYNHVEIMVRAVGSNLGSVSYGAVYPVSRKCKYSEVFNHYSLVKTRPVKISIDQYEAIKVLNDLCGRKYSFLQIIVLLFKISFHLLTSPMSKVKLNLDKYLICTELVGIFLEKSKGFQFDSDEALTLTELDKDWI